MEQPPKLLPGGLIVALLDARLDRQDPLGDDSPAPNERFVVKVLAGVERVAEIHSHVHQLDDGDGPAEALGRLRDPAGRGHAFGGEGLRLQWHTVTKEATWTGGTSPDLPCALQKRRNKLSQVK